MRTMYRFEAFPDLSDVREVDEVGMKEQKKFERASSSKLNTEDDERATCSMSEWKSQVS